MDNKYVVELYRNASVYPNKQTFLTSYFDRHREASVLDVEFYGQGFQTNQPDWPHNIICSRVRRCVGIDIAPEVATLRHEGYVVYRMNAEDFHLNERFDIIYAGDVIEHLSNPGRFLECSSKHLTDGGEIVESTPNPYFLTNIL